MGLISNGTTIFDNGAMASGFGGDMVFISSATAAGSTSVEFTSGIDSTYKEYIFFLANIHNSVTDKNILVNFSTDGGSNYNVTKTTSYFRAYHGENGSGGVLEYRTGSDLAQSTAAQMIMNGIRSDNDGCGVGYLHLFNPASTTFVKHFIATTNIMQDNLVSDNAFVAGYGNTTSAINAVQFSVNSGNIDDGKILMFGIN